MDHSPFHPGERAAQTRAGLSRPPSGAAIRDFMPEQHRSFFALLPILPVATLGAGGMPMATILAGAPGFVASPDARTLRIGAIPDPGDPTAPWFVPGAPIGILGIDPATRRRNRANGRIRETDATGLTVAVGQSFGNCPQYIQTRDLLEGTATTAGEVEHLARLDMAARDAVAAADTFFVASSAGANGGPAGGMDMSHRGGRPGFVRVLEGDTLEIPDYHGNGYFNTLGNLLLDPRGAPRP
jgi:predicted pyridoxine 5'-phosphate oxidase superfamily flavin-nucleotide-binding protein